MLGHPGGVLGGAEFDEEPATLGLGRTLAVENLERLGEPCHSIGGGVSGERRPGRPGGRSRPPWSHPPGGWRPASGGPAPPGARGRRCRCPPALRPP